MRPLIRERRRWLVGISFSLVAVVTTQLGCSITGLLPEFTAAGYLDFALDKDQSTMSGPFSEIERKLRPLADPLQPPAPGDWLAQHPEAGQTFTQYLAARPIRKSQKLHTIYFCLIGDFNEPEQRILQLTQDYLEIFFDCPVKTSQRVTLASIPSRAKRTRSSGGQQLLTGYILHEVLEPNRPDDALAYVALTASDLWPGRGWNFVFGEANLRERTGVWSIHRNGDPSKDAAAFQLCLDRTLNTASHELCHILTMQHCTAFHCLMNGSNHQEERDRRPLHLCPVCLRKLCWNLQVEPVRYLKRLQVFCAKHGQQADANWCEKAMAILTRPTGD
jgi:archaemetzincin